MFSIFPISKSGWKSPNSWSVVRWWWEPYVAPCLTAATALVHFLAVYPSGPKTSLPGTALATRHLDGSAPRHKARGACWDRGESQPPVALLKEGALRSLMERGRAGTVMIAKGWRSSKSLPLLQIPCLPCQKLEGAKLKCHKICSQA